MSVDLLGPEALLQASRDGKFRLIRLLVDGGTLPNVRTANQETPLILTCMSKSEEKEKIVEFLIKHRVKVNLQDIHGKTALMYACLTNASDNVVRMLVNSKANPWLVDEDKNTAFDFAINAGNIGTVRLMIQAFREGKILTKPGSFNMEMKRLEDRLEKLPEIRKCSWPLMGPRSGSEKPEKIFTQSSLLVVKEDDEVSETPTRERRRKRSICHFDPIEIDNNEHGEAKTDEVPPKPLRKGSLHSVRRSSSSEDERISLHFSDSNNSSFDRASTNYSSLERLLRLHDSLSTSVESNESLNSQSSLKTGLKIDDLIGKVKELERKNSPKTSSETAEIGKPGKAVNVPPIKSTVESAISDGNERERVISLDKANKFETCKDEQEVLVEENRMENQRKVNIEKTDLLNKIDHNNLDPTRLPCTRNRILSPRTSRRRTTGSLATPQQCDVIENWGLKKPGDESGVPRRFTVSSLEVVKGDKLRSSTRREEILFRPYPPSRDKNIFSPEMRYLRRIRSPEAEMTNIVKRPITEQDLDWEFKSLSLHSSPTTTKRTEVKHIKPIIVPVISQPEEAESNENNNTTSLQSEKKPVRRTVSDSACAIDHRCGQDSSVSGQGAHCACAADSLASVGSADSRERSASFTNFVRNTSPQERMRKNSTNAIISCDIVTMATTHPGQDSPRGRTPHNRLSSDLPDLVLHPPQRVRLPSNLDSSPSKYELQINDPARSPRSPEVLCPISPGSHGRQTGSFMLISKTGSYTHLPEVVNGTTGSPKERRAVFLPPLNISRKPLESEEGYFSCSPSPMDLESPNRGKDKSKYSFKPLSPRLTNKTLKNL